MASESLLGEFLRARRAITTPGQVGPPDTGLRRTPGPRREEVAMPAEVSTNYYVRLEQGRERHPSDQVIGALAEVSGRSGDSRRLWARHDVRKEVGHVVCFHHELVGELTVDCDMFSVAEAPGRRLVTVQAAPGSPSAHALAVLCRRARERDPVSGRPARRSDAGSERPVLGRTSC
ncbi:helix-turn-helix transcriptional regulator [Streptosporangium sp. NPDC023825]|uniref:helix-turn-helix transcriptional regulator n=1 Tax=Streptosporangium sp. NPDC023825 TaxID=3154909 RepID=UPI00343ADDE4